MASRADEIIQDKGRWKSFLALFKRYRAISPEGIIMMKSNVDSAPVKFVIHGISGIEPKAAKASPDSAFLLVLSATFYSKSKAAFFGRTYKTVPLTMAKEHENSVVFKFEMPHTFVYFQRVANPADVILVLELETKKLNTATNTVESDCLIGWTFVEHPLRSCPQKKRSFFQGTARSAYNLNTSDTRTSQLKTTLDYEIKEDSGIIPLAKLMPNLLIVGSDEEIPGVLNDRFINSIEDLQVDLVRTTLLYLEGVKLVITEDIETAILDDCRKFRLDKFGNETAGNASDVYISKRKLSCVFHNGLTAINQNGWNHSIDLVGRERTEYVNNGSFALTNVFIHDKTCIIFQVDFTINIPYGHAGEEVKEVCVGWAPFFLQDGMKGSINQVSTDFITGPGKSLSMRNLFELKHRRESTMLFLSGNLNMTEIMSKPEPSSFVDDRNSGKDSRANLEMMQKLREKERLLAELQRERDMYRTYAETTKEKLRDFENNSNLLSVDAESRLRPITPIKEFIPKPSYLPISESQYPSHLDKQTIIYKEDEKLKNEINDMKQMIKDLYQTTKDIKENNFSRDVSPQQNFPGGRIGGPPPVFYSTLAPNYPPKVSYDPYMRAGEQMKGAQYMRDITREERANLLHYGVGGLLDAQSGQRADGKVFSKQREIDDSRKISRISIQMLSVKYFPDFETGEAPSHVPKSLMLSFNFFDFPLFKSKILGYLNADKKNINTRELLAGKQLILANDDFIKGVGDRKEAMYNFEIDPSKTGTLETHARFIDYISTKELVIDLWDGDSLLYYGQAKVALCNLLRQGKESEMFSASLDIINTEQGYSELGVLQITIKNTGFELPQGAQVAALGKESYGKVGNNNFGKKKARSFKPLDITEELKRGLISAGGEGHDDEGVNEERRKLLRLQRYKMLKAQQARAPASGFVNEESDELFKKTLKEIEMVREQRKPEIIKNALRGGYSEESKIVTHYGECKYIKYRLENNFKGVKDFRVKVDRGTTIASEEEFDLIRDPKEWREVSAVIDSEPPAEWGLLQSGDIISLRADESVELIFRFLTYDEAILENGCNGIVKTCGFCVTDLSGHIVGGISLSFEVKTPLIDRTLRFFELEGRTVELPLPRLFSEEMIRNERPFIVSTNPKAKVNWIDSIDVSLSLRTPTAPSVMRFFVPVYKNIYRSVIMGIFCIEIHSQEGHDLNVKVGELQTVKLEVRTGIPRMVKIFSNNERVVKFHNRYESQFELLPNSANKILFNVRAFKPGKSNLIINCVETHSKELVHGWTFRLQADPAECTKEIHEEVRIGEQKSMKYPFSNTTNQYTTFDIVSSNPDLIKPQESRMALDAGQKDYLRFVIFPQRTEGTQDAMIYISDIEGIVSECWRAVVEIKY